jgi:hypothetical protein
MEVAGYVINAVLVEGRRVTEVCAATTVSRSWLYELIARRRELGHRHRVGWTGQRAQVRSEMGARRARATEGRPAMERHVIAAELSAAGAQELLAATSSAHLAYNAEDRTPRVIPVGFFWTGTEFVISTATTSPKVAALIARPEVALSIDGGDAPEQARALSVRGRASVEIVDGVVPEYLAAARKSMGAEAAVEFEKNCREMYDQMARIAIVPSWACFYDFNAGRVPRFLKELAERNRS